jgi:hypothetical protein
MPGKLASVVLAMEVDRRRNLLKRTILPSVFDGRPDASVLHAFPDPDLAESSVSVRRKPPHGGRLVGA